MGRAKATGLGVRKHFLDNECSNAMKELIRSECMLELVPPHCHGRVVFSWVGHLPYKKIIKSKFGYLFSWVTKWAPKHPIELFRVGDS